MSAGTWERAPDAEPGDYIGGMLIGITAGDFAGELRRIAGNPGEIVVGTDAITAELQQIAGGGPNTDYKVAVSFFRSNADFIEDNSGSWRSYAKIIFEGSDNITPPTSAKLILWTSMPGDSVKARLRNITAGVNLFDETITPGNSPIITLFNLVNIPTTEVILELQLMKVGNANYRLASFNLATT
jgi:hypothetical protein